MRIAQVMTRDVKVIRPDEKVRDAARLMDELNIGSLPVCNGQKLVGMITDRDITVRTVASGDDPDETPVAQAMSTDLRWCHDDDSTDDVMSVMQDVQIRRMPVIDNDKNLIGIVALGDLATKLDGDGVGETLREISQPSEPER